MTTEDPKEQEYPTSAFCEELQTLILSLHTVVWVHTQEENRAVNEIMRAVEYLRTRPKYVRPANINFGVWTLTSGLKAWSNPRAKEPQNETSKPEYLDTNPEMTTEPERAIDWVEKFARDIVVVFKDMHQVLHDAGPCRRLKDFITYSHQQNRKNPPVKIIVIISPVLNIPVELEKSVTVLDFSLPNEKEIAESLENIMKTVSQGKKDGKTNANLPTTEEQETIVKLAKGLTIQEFEDAMAKCLIDKKRPPIETIKEQKKQIVIKNGILEMMDTVNMDDVGGLDRLKDWLTERHAGWTVKGREYGLKTPRGLLLLGVQGCGKSLVSKAIAGAWGLPNYNLDAGKLFSSAVGSSESTTRNVLKTIEALAPVVVTLDEIDKSLAGSQSSSFSDSGVTARVIGTFLSWLNDHKSEVFVVATANSVKALPPELLRKGRFSECFFVDLPALKERVDIFKIHIQKVGRNPAEFDLEKFASLTEHFSGAEIESIVETALIKSFKDNGLKDTHILQSIHQTVPLWSTRKEEIQELIDWVGRDDAKKDGIRAVFASSASFFEGSKLGENNIVSFKKQEKE